MPDQFGNPTPQEVVASIQERSRRSFLQAQATGSPGVQAGASLAAIFGGPIRTTLDTRAARKAEATRLQKVKGISREQAEDEARSTVGRERREVRQARRIQDATTEMQTFMSELDPNIPIDVRQAQGQLFLSNRMRNMGLTTQANQLATSAQNAMLAAETRLAEMEGLRQRTRGAKAGADIAEAELPFVGASTFTQNLLKREQFIGQLNDPNTQLSPFQRESLMRMKGELDAKIYKDGLVIGRTEEDVRNDPTLMRKLFVEVSDAQVLINNIDEAIVQLGDLDSFDSSVWAGYAKDALGAMETWLGRRPTENEREFMERIIEKEGKPTIIAAKIRHALTGAQMSAFEIVFLTPFLPSPSDSPAEMIGKMRVVKEYTQIDVDTRMAMFQMGLTHDSLKNAVSTGGPIELGPPPNSDAATAAGDKTIDELIAERQGELEGT